MAHFFLKKIRLFIQTTITVERIIELLFSSLTSLDSTGLDSTGLDSTGLDSTGSQEKTKTKYLVFAPIQSY